MKRTTHKPRRGNIIVLSGALLTCLLALVALAVDVGYIAHAHTELQRTADAVALAAAAKLPNQLAAMDAGIATAQDNNTSIATTLSSEDFVFGWWSRRNGTFTSPAPTNRPTNAVQVTVSRTAARGNPINLFFGQVVNRNSTDMTVKAIGYSDRSLCGPFVGIEWVAVDGTPGADSYDSVDGPYDSTTANKRGSVCSDGDITVSGSAVVSGDATAGPDLANDEVILNGGGTVLGRIGNRIKPLNMPPVDATQAALYNNNANLPKVLRSSTNGDRWVSPVDKQGDFVLHSGDIVEMPPGDYYFRKATINAGATLMITGNTNIYITDDFTLAGNAYLVNTTMLASNLEFYMTGGKANITSDTTFYGVVYAPNTDVTLNAGGDFYGAVVGKTLSVKGGGLGHYDESLELEEVTLPTRTTIVD
ncbi:MAG TPA: pilus assembly protein TadG-related protein [Pirellulaceae bacterium]|nr:pilus assembly protein TadG-related protein [Pirellulaceae bacterium]